MTNTKHILTIGLNDQHTKTQKYDTITAYKMIENILTEYTTGYTMYETIWLKITSTTIKHKIISHDLKPH